MRPASLRAQQLLSLPLLALLSPALRLIPGSPAAAAGRAAWLSPLAALPILLLYLGFLCLFCGRRGPEEGLAELCLRCLGQRAGRIFLLFAGLWLLLFAGFSLRAGAERCLLTVFPHASPAVFVLPLALLALWAALGKLRSVGRLARMLLAPLGVLLLVLLLAALPDLHAGNLLPVTLYELPAALRGSPPVLEIAGILLLCPCFFLDRAESLSFRGAALSLAGALALLTLLSAAVLGNFGAALTQKLRLPFFTLVRNLVFFRSLERVEALTVSLWVFPDLVLETLLLRAAVRCLRAAFGSSGTMPEEPRLSLRGGRWLLPLAALAAAGIALTLAPDARSFARWSDELIPAWNLVFLALFPPVALIGKLRKKI